MKAHAKSMQNLVKECNRVCYLSREGGAKKLASRKVLRPSKILNQEGNEVRENPGAFRIIALKKALRVSLESQP